MARIIKHEYFFPHPPEMVWAYLTKSELMELWLMKNDFQPIVGHDFQFRTSPVPAFDFDGIFYCKVLVVEPFTNLSYSWNCGPGNGEINLESVVNWTLEAKDNGTEVYLEHSGFEREDNIGLFNGLNHGWTEKFVKIAKLITERYGNADA